VHGGKVEAHLGFYPVQIKAAQALWSAIAGVTDVELKAPLDSGKTSTDYSKDVVSGKFAGVISHYHCSKKKIDCAGLDIAKLIKEI